MYDANSVAYYIIKYHEECNDVISNLKLQKLLYFVQAQFLVYKGEPCFSDEIEAWDCGPIVRRVYYKYKHFGASFIILNKRDPLIPYYQTISESDKEIINSIVQMARKFSASELMRIVLNQKPYKDAIKYKHNISNESLYEYFKNP